MDVELTTGGLEEIFKENLIEQPVLQVLDFKPIQNGPYLRHRLLISDGKFKSTSTMIGTQLNEMIGKEITANAVFRVDRYIVNTVQEVKKVMILLDITLLAAGDKVGRVIGSPIVYESYASGNANSLSREQTGANKPARSTATDSRSSGAPVGVHPIASLSPYQNKWTICARVTNKSDIRTWSNSRGQGKLFSLDLLDESGEIRATAFNDQCDKFYNMIEINKVYYISQAQLKTANKQFSSLKNDYEMTFNPGTQVTLCHDNNTKIPAMQFEFVKIELLEQVEKDSTVDVIGVCREDLDMSVVTQKSTGKEIKKRDIQIVDDTGKEIRLTLWGNTAEKFDGSQNPIVAVKGAKVSDFNGKSLSLLSSSTLQINPDIKEAHKLRAWFENVGAQMEVISLSNQKMSAGAVGGNLKTIGDAALENLGCGDQADYYSLKATVIRIRRENCLYTACPAENCNKKVVDQNNGIYRCEKCNKEYDSFNYRLMVTALFADATGSVWVTMFQEQAETLIGCSAAELGIKKETSDSEFVTILSEALFKEYLVKFRVKMETYNGESRLKTTAVTVQPINFKEHNKFLVQQIKNIAGLSNN